MKKDEKQLQHFTIKGELIGTINLTDTFKKVREIVEHEGRHKCLFINNNQEIVDYWDLSTIEDDKFPILVIKPLKKNDREGEPLLAE